MGGHKYLVGRERENKKTFDGEKEGKKEERGRSSLSSSQRGLRGMLSAHTTNGLHAARWSDSTVEFRVFGKS